jgi:FkbM family methyltransferase
MEQTQVVVAAKRIYEYIFARECMQGFNSALFKLALHGLGFNLSHELDKSGELHFLKRLGRFHPGLCIDIGANVGSYATALLESTDSTVICFEPLPETYSKLCSLKTTYGSRVLMKNCAIGESNTTMTIRYDPDRTELSSLSESALNVDYVKQCCTQSETVEVRTLDAVLESEFEPYLSQGIDLIKIDVEGFERQVLTGAQQTIRRFRPRFIQMEYNMHQMYSQQSLWQFSQLLSGYDCYQLLPRGWRKIDPRQAESNVYYYSNFVFARQ